MDWENKPEDLAKAMEMVPIMDAFIKQIKAVVRGKLEENPESVPGLKLRKGGNMTTYEACKVAEILMSTNVLTWDDFLKACRYTDSAMVKVWSDKRGISQGDARKDLKKRLGEVAQSRPKASSVVKDNDAKG